MEKKEKEDAKTQQSLIQNLEAQLLKMLNEEDDDVSLPKFVN